MLFELPTIASSIVILIVLIFFLFLLFQRKILASKIFFKILKDSPIFVALLVLITTGFIIVTIWHPGFFILTIPALLILGIKIWEWSDDQFLDNKIGGWVESQKKVFIKIIPSPSSNASVADMEKFMLMLSGAYSNINQKQFRTTGKYFEEFSFEIFSESGRVSFYVKMYKNSLDLFVTAAKLYFPLVQFVEVEDPFLNYPKSFRDAKEIWKNVDQGEFGLFGNEIYPLKYHTDVSFAKQEYKQTPINQLVDVLENVEEGDNVILQFLFRPMDPSKTGQKKVWEKEMTKLRKDLAANSSVSVGTGGAINPYTPQEIEIINGAEKKISAPVFITKVRFALFGKTITGKRYLSGIMAYWKNFFTDKQGLIPSPKGWDESANATWGPLWDNLYWKPEIQKRGIQMYEGLLNRSISSGGKTKYWDLYSIVSILQIPNKFLDRRVIRVNDQLLEANTSPQSSESQTRQINQTAKETKNLNDEPPKEHQDQEKGEVSNVGIHKEPDVIQAEVIDIKPVEKKGITDSELAEPSQPEPIIISKPSENIESKPESEKNTIDSDDDFEIPDNSPENHNISFDKDGPTLEEMENWQVQIENQEKSLLAERLKQKQIEDDNKQKEDKENIQKTAENAQQVNEPAPFNPQNTVPLNQPNPNTTTENLLEDEDLFQPIDPVNEMQDPNSNFNKINDPKIKELAKKAGKSWFGN